MNKHIIIAVLFIGGTGIVKAFTTNKPIEPVIIGTYIFMFVLSILDMFGGPLSDLAGSLAMLALVYVLLDQFPWSTILGNIQGKK